MGVSGRMLGWSFNVSGKFIMLPEAYLGINSMSVNPFSNNCPNTMIQTGISAINTMNSIARSQ